MLFRPLPEELFSNLFYVTKITRLSFFNFGLILSSLDPNSHFMTEICRTKILRLGLFSFCQLKCRQLNISSICSSKFQARSCFKDQLKSQLTQRTNLSKLKKARKKKLIFLKDWWHLVAFIDHYTHLTHSRVQLFIFK